MHWSGCAVSRRRCRFLRAQDEQAEISTPPPPTSPPWMKPSKRPRIQKETERAKRIDFKNGRKPSAAPHSFCQRKSGNVLGKKPARKKALQIFGAGRKSRKNARALVGMKPNRKCQLKRFQRIQYNRPKEKTYVNRSQMPVSSRRRRYHKPGLVADPVEARTSAPAFLKVQSDG